MIKGQMDIDLLERSRKRKRREGTARRGEMRRVEVKRGMDGMGNERFDKQEEPESEAEAESKQKIQTQVQLVSFTKHNKTGMDSEKVFVLGV